ncbi:MAG: periplasmic binding protein [Marmoricola sp.]|nr:periplasmic binding protein [Marmoricola sp.]
MDAPRRIVSLLPSATEILFAIGAGDQVVGVTFECDHPTEARERRIVSTSALPEGLSSADIDAFVAAAVRAGEDLYHLDAGALADIDADLVVTQDLCAVCAVDVSVVDDALEHLGCTAEVITTDPHTLEEVLDTIVVLGEATGHREEADALVASLRARLDAVAARVAARSTPAPRVLLLEWTDPPYAPGHWVPEMVTLAGGVPVLGRAGAKSVRVTWEDARAGDPEVVVCAPCGFDLDGSAALARDLVAGGELPAHLPVWAVDANASFARPGPRLVDGIEALERLVEVTAGAAAPDEWWSDLGSATPPLLVRDGGVGGTPEGHPPRRRAVLRDQG